MSSITNKARLSAVVVLLALMAVVDSTLYLVSFLADASLGAVAVALLWPMFKAK